MFSTHKTNAGACKHWSSNVLPEIKQASRGMSPRMNLIDLARNGGNSITLRLTPCGSVTFCFCSGFGA